MTEPAFQYLRDEGRHGEFFIHVDRLFDESTFHAMRRCIVVKADRTFTYGDGLRYEVFHPDLPETPNGIIPPLYRACLDSGGRLVFIDAKHGWERIPEDWLGLWERKRD